MPRRTTAADPAYRSWAPEQRGFQRRGELELRDFPLDHERPGLAQRPEWNLNAINRPVIAERLFDQRLPRRVGPEGLLPDEGGPPIDLEDDRSQSGGRKLERQSAAAVGVFHLRQEPCCQLAGLGRE